MKVYLVKEWGAPTPVVVLADEADLDSAIGQLRFYRTTATEGQVVRDFLVYGAGPSQWRTFRYIREVTSVGSN